MPILPSPRPIIKIGLEGRGRSQLHLLRCTDDAHTHTHTHFVQKQSDVAQKSYIGLVDIEKGVRKREKNE